MYSQDPHSSMSERREELSILQNNMKIAKISISTSELFAHLEILSEDSTTTAPSTNAIFHSCPDSSVNEEQEIVLDPRDAVILKYLEDDGGFTESVSSMKINGYSSSATKRLQDPDRDQTSSNDTLTPIDSPRSGRQTNSNTFILPEEGRITPKSHRDNDEPRTLHSHPDEHGRATPTSTRSNRSTRSHHSSRSKHDLENEMQRPSSRRSRGHDPIEIDPDQELVEVKTCRSRPSSAHAHHSEKGRERRERRDSCHEEDRRPCHSHKHSLCEHHQSKHKHHDSDSERHSQRKHSRKSDKHSRKEHSVEEFFEELVKRESSGKHKSRRNGENGIGVLIPVGDENSEKAERKRNGKQSHVIDVSLISNPDEKFGRNMRARPKSQET